MPWTLTEGEDGFILSKLMGHMAEPFAVVMDQQKAIHLLKVLEWADVLASSGVVPAPPVFKPKRKRPRRA